ncbi:uncharacterized oxidoreductase [Sphingomonas guangdongensis]|uniref:Uncharacterized oxidoreductase n=1 Tax=Sphingomonas guangdongensis TaxID=1141890 RepID=A0A285QYN6_9SPHN|nr:SDR family oxidoreductase [Sphingomonas guangdongensis]SOB87085.1 uncharacterized oxidoreductase [Sphingomonas guangdongensis]
MKQSGNTILITGGGSGIGEALAHRWHDAGNTVIIAGRRQEALDAAAAGRDNIHTLTLDVESAAGVVDFAQRLLAAHPAVNVLVNNAGIMRYEKAGEARDLADAEATIETNLLGPIRLTDALVDHLSGQADAAIINVTSGLAFVPLAATPTYSATKAAIHSYTVSLRKVLEGEVEVIELAPPGVQTSLTPGQENRDGYQPLDEFADEVMALFAQEPTPSEILVERVRAFRHAEKDGTLDKFVDQLYDMAKARGA